MAKKLVAKTEPRTTITWGESVFQFGPDGARHITQGEREELERYLDSGPGTVSITFDEVDDESVDKPDVKEEKTKKAT